MSDDDFEPENSTTDSPNPLRGPKVVSTPPISKQTPASSQSLPIEENEPKKRRKTGGKQKGWRKVSNSMSNGRFTEEDVYVYAPKDTVPKEQQERFLGLCDLMIKSLGVDTMADTDLEEIALYYRDRIYCDHLYKTFADAGGTTDSTLIAHIEKLNKALEQRKSNLGSRFVDKGKKRRDTNTSSFMELLSKFEQDKTEFENESNEKAALIENNKQNFTSTADYMTSHAGSKKISSSGE